MDCHGGQALHLGKSRDDADPAAGAAQLRCDMISTLEVLGAVGQDHQVATGSIGRGPQLLDRDVTLCCEDWHPTERGDGLSQPGAGDYGQTLRRPAANSAAAP